MKKLHDSLVTLLEQGSIDLTLHYGPFARDWWVIKTQTKNTDCDFRAIPYRLYMRTVCLLNNTEFTIVVVKREDNPLQPGFICSSKEQSTGIVESASQAINILYHKIYNTNTEYSGPVIMGFNNPKIIRKLLDGVKFLPFSIKVGPYIVVISDIGNKPTNISDDLKSGFTSSLLTRLGSKRCLVLQRIAENQVTLDFYCGSVLEAHFEDKLPTTVWKKTGILKKYDGNTLFGLEDSCVQQEISKTLENITCSSEDWSKPGILEQIFDRHIRVRKTSRCNLLQWQDFFINWKDSENSILTFDQILQALYPLTYDIPNNERCAWRAMLKACGCTNVTPFSKKVSSIEFWSKSNHSQVDKANLQQLYKQELLNLNQNDVPVYINTGKNDVFWESFRIALKANKRGSKGSIRLLSIIAEKFSYLVLREKLAVIICFVFTYNQAIFIEYLHLRSVQIR